MKVAVFYSIRNFFNSSIVIIELSSISEIRLCNILWQLLQTNAISCLVVFVSLLIHYLFRIAYEQQVYFSPQLKGVQSHLVKAVLS